MYRQQWRACSRMPVISTVQAVGRGFQAGEGHFQIKQIAVSIEEFVGRKGANTKIALDSCLLFIGQVIVSHIVAAYIYAP